MRLSEFDGKFGLRVIRDGGFEGTGKLSTPLPARLVPLRSERYAAQTNACGNAAAVIALPGLEDMLDPRLAVAVCDDPDAAHSEIHAICAARHDQALRERPALIHPEAIIHPSACVPDHGVEIERGVRIGPGAVIAPGVILQEECHVRAGCTVGEPAFNLGRIGGRRRILASIGGVRIGPGAELAAQVCIDAAMFGGHTIIGAETAIDHHAYIAHDVVIGDRATICGHAAVMGRAVIGDRTYVGPGAVVVNGARVGAGAKVTMGAVVTRDVAEGAVVSGNFALPHDRFLDNLRRDR